MRIRVIDAFTDRPFAGNPAGVCVLDAGPWPDEEWMRQVAAEMNHAETAFTKPDDDGTWALRWFTPVAEADLCGHATLATTHALHSDGLVDSEVRFTSRSGLLIAEIAADGTITLDFPAAIVTEASVPEGLEKALGVTPISTHSTGALRDLLVVLPDEQAVRAVAPDLTAIAGINQRENIRGIVVTAAAAEAGSGYDFVSRFFSPNDGIPEDPVTGSAHTALAPFWADRLGRTDLAGWQASTRGGLVRAVPVGDRVRLTGRAVTVLDGTLHT
jgi:PhzF family phenazine biosynthesis protein